MEILLLFNDGKKAKAIDINLSPFLFKGRRCADLAICINYTFDKPLYTSPPRISNLRDNPRKNCAIPPFAGKEC
jgi:hypothetical protein